MRTIVGIATGLALLVPGLAFGRDAPAAPNWDSALASQAAAVPATRSGVSELFDLLRAGDAEALRSRLDAVIAGRDLTQPERDAILFQFAVGLADFEAVDAVLIERLRAVRPSVLVSHEERAELGVPLFNISGAADGVYRLGLRREGRARARQLANGPADVWVEAYLQSGPATRAGFGDSLDEAPDEALRRILAASLARPSDAPGLTPVIGRSALLLGDSEALVALLRSGAGADLPRVLEAAGLTLTPEQGVALLRSAIAEAPPANAALAIAQLFPRLSTQAPANDLLFAQLGNADLGAAAALALARAGDSDAHARLRRIAQSGEEPAASRARTALELATRRPGAR